MRFNKLILSLIAQQGITNALQLDRRAVSEGAQGNLDFLEQSSHQFDRTGDIEAAIADIYTAIDALPVNRLGEDGRTLSQAILDYVIELLDSDEWLIDNTDHGALNVASMLASLVTTRRHDKTFCESVFYAVKSTVTQTISNLRDGCFDPATATTFFDVFEKVFASLDNNNEISELIGDQWTLVQHRFAKCQFNTLSCGESYTYTGNFINYDIGIKASDDNPDVVSRTFGNSTIENFNAITSPLNCVNYIAGNLYLDNIANIKLLASNIPGEEKWRNTIVPVYTTLKVTTDQNRFLYINDTHTGRISVPQHYMDKYGIQDYNMNMTSTNHTLKVIYFKFPTQTNVLSRSEVWFDYAEVTGQEGNDIYFKSSVEGTFGLVLYKVPFEGEVIPDLTPTATTSRVASATPTVEVIRFTGTQNWACFTMCRDCKVYRVPGNFTWVDEIDRRRGCFLLGTSGGDGEDDGDDEGDQEA